MKDIPVIEPKEIIEEIYNLRTGEKYNNDEEWKAKGIPESEIRKDVRVIMPSLDLFGETKQNGTMAITRAQQAKQMLQNGGRIGFQGGGKDASKDDFGSGKGNYGQGAGAQFSGSGGDISPGTNLGGGFRDDNPFNEGPPNVLNPAPQKVITPKPKPKIKPNLPSLNTFERFRLLGLKNLYDQKVGLKSAIPSFASILNYNNPSLDFYESTDETDLMDTQYGLSGDTITDLDRLADAINTAEKTGNLSQSQFEDAFYGPDGKREINEGGGGEEQDPCKGPNPPAYCFAGIKSLEPEPEPEEEFEFYRRFRAEGGRAEYKQGSPKVDPRMKNTLAQNVATNNAQAAANAIQQAINTQTLTSPSSKMMTPPQLQNMPVSGTGPLFNPGFTVNTPTGPATFSSPGNFGPQGISIDGKIYYSEQEAIKDLGIERYNQLMADGGRAGFAEGGMPYEGGIMDLESARQMYGLGKLVKKVTRSVKKIAKSPIGKAALLYAGTAGLGALGAGAARAGTGFGIFSPTNVLSNLGASKALLTNKLFGDVVGPSKTSKSLFDLVGGKAGAAILGTSLVAGMLTPAQEEEAQRISDETGIDINEIRNNPDKYLGRRFKAEGGIMDKEPVAKKTMPLLDMDGQEMDFRAEGGFVPIGRMEKADDVPARLSKNEFVFTADAVRNAGDGDVDKGAEVMYNMMKNLESGGDVSEESQGLEGARKMFQTSQRLEEVL